ncbi:MAG: AAA family ATPase [Balneolaceae bacterium]
MPRLEVLKHNDKEITGFLDRVSQINLDRSHYLIIFIGAYQAGKTNLIKRLQKKIGEFIEIDLSTVISQNEEESYKNIDELFSVIAKSDKNILFNHGDVLAGQYTGYTYSSVRYATPQEKYFLKKITGSERFYVLNLKETAAIDKTLERFAQTSIQFDQPASFLGLLFWKIRQIKLQGHTFASKRPTLTAGK